MKSYYSTGGNLYSMAFNSSTPILYYNKDLFKKAGLAEAADDLGRGRGDGEEAVRRGVKCAFSSAWPSWVLIENMHGYHDQPFSDHRNGFDGLATTLKINGAFGIKMMELWRAAPRKAGSCMPGGSTRPRPISPPASAAIFRELVGVHRRPDPRRGGQVHVGDGLLPRMAGFPQGNSIIGGATLWVMKGAKPEEYKGVAQFFKYVASTENQAWWAGVTGYLPLTNAAMKAMEASGHCAKNPKQLDRREPDEPGKTTPNSQGIRLGNYTSVRDAIEEQMENIFSGKKTAKQGLDDAVAKGNEILKEFAALYK